MRLPPLANGPALVALLACALGTWLRVVGVADQPLAGDENIAAKTIYAGYRAILTTFDANGSHAGFPLAQRIALDLFGHSVFAYRLPAVLAGTLTLWCLYPLGRRLVGEGPAALATALLAVHPMHVYYSRDARPYALAALLAFLFVVSLARALAPDGARRSWIGVASCAGLLPWVHLTGASLVVLLGIVTLVGLRWSGRSTRDGWLAFGAGALLTLLLYAPALGGLVEYVQELGGRGERQSFPPHEILSLFGGSIVAGIVLLPGGLASALALRRSSPWGAALLGAAMVAPILLLLVTHPKGVAWAHARYLFVAIVPFVLASAWGVVAVLGHWLDATSTRALAAALVAVGFALTSPTGYASIGEPFAKSDWGMLRHDSRLDEEYAGTPAFYRHLAGDPEPMTLVEFPYNSRLVLLYRCYARVHGKAVLAGYLEGGFANDTFRAGREATPALVARAPYFPLDREVLPDARIDWVIVHLDVYEELRAYARAVGLPLRMPDREPIGDSLERIEGAWGPPDFRDETLAAWHLSARR